MDEKKGYQFSPLAARFARTIHSVWFAQAPKVLQEGCSLNWRGGLVGCKVEREFVVLPVGHTLFEVFPADGLVGLVASDLDLCALLDDAAVVVESQHHGGFAATVADRLDLNQAVGPGEQVLAPLKQLPLKIGSQPVAKYRDSEVIGHITKLVYLVASEKLGFINEQAVQCVVSMSVTDQRQQVVGG